MGDVHLMFTDERKMNRKADKRIFLRKRQQDATAVH